MSLAPLYSKIYQLILAGKASEAEAYLTEHEWLLPEGMGKDDIDGKHDSNFTLCVKLMSQQLTEKKDDVCDEF